MATVADISLKTWTRQSSSPFYDGNTPGSLRPGVGGNLGINLNSNNDYTPVHVFTNFMKSARRYMTGSSGTWDTGERELLQYDANGYLTSLDLTALTATEVRFVYALEADLAGDWIFTWDGDGTFSLSGGTVNASSYGRMEVNLTAGNTWFTYLTLNESDYPRNFRLARPADEFNTAMYTQPFLDSLSFYKCLRFMDMLSTNHSINSTWANRSNLDSYTWTRTVTAVGVPIEACCQLLKDLPNTPDGWFCVPHLADDNYITNMAQLLLAEMPLTSRCYIEYSNECWNNMFDQQVYCQEQGELEYGTSTSPWESAWSWYGKRSNRVAEIFKSVWTGANASRLTTIMATQSVSTFVSNRVLSCPRDASAPCDTFIDALAIAPYFGSDACKNEHELTVQNWTVDDLFNEMATSALPGGTPEGTSSVDKAVSDIAAQKAIADTYGLELISYEGGQHLVGYDGGTKENQAITDLLIAANRDPRMGDLYREYLTRWDGIGAGVFVAFSHTYAPNKHGSWGSMETITDTTNPKYLALKAYAEGTI